MRDPDANLTPRGTKVCKFAIASNRYYKQEGVRNSEVSYFDVEVWSKVAESCEKHLNKGRGVCVVGRLKQERWTDDLGGSHSKIKIVGCMWSSSLSIPVLPDPLPTRVGRKWKPGRSWLKRLSSDLKCQNL